jgi:hypothetical protein
MYNNSGGFEDPPQYCFNHRCLLGVLPPVDTDEILATVVICTMAAATTVIRSDSVTFNVKDKGPKETFWL